ncbi:uncharacterized protein LOC120015281 isoform X2 [Tripterygium wilfordii]|uniref:uncharacterized protein LOC120015281 isoform X2 n=1 Tax=Tripterygium wilfordii TaxID=458696 RepID=UPI0018F7F836|nr:uncharacterized protein LOC120015281 isoform X2 [Tripterygium wilfordii]
MTREALDSPVLEFYRDSAIVSSDRIVNNLCSQTGEEFSTEFLRDRIAIRRVPVMTDEDQYQTGRLGLNYNQIHELAYKDVAGINRLMKKDSESNSEEFVPRMEFLPEVDNRFYPDPISRYHQEHVASGQNLGTYADHSYFDQDALRPTVAQGYGAGSHQMYNPFGKQVLEESISAKMKFLCSFGGRILPRPSDGKLRYVGGETRIISIRKNLSFVELMKKTLAICNQPHTIKYQLPGEDLDALISVSSDEDLLHMIEEYQVLERNGGSQRLRIFLVSLGESEGPCSFEGRAPKQNDADNQYVFAVNGMMDMSPQKSSSGQSLASQTNQLGNVSDYSPSFPRDSPTFSYALESMDQSPSYSNMVGLGMFPNPTAQFWAKLKIPNNSFNQSSPVSPRTLHQGDHKNSNALFFSDGRERINPFVMEKLPCEFYGADASSYYNNVPYGPLPLMNCHHANQYLVEAGHTNKPCETHFHNRSPSGDYVPSQLHGQRDINTDRSILIERALSDSQLQEHEKRSTHFREGVSQLSQWNHSPAMSNSSQEWPIDRSDSYSGQDRKFCVCTESTSEESNSEYKNFPNLNYLPSNHGFADNLRDSGSTVSSSSVIMLENSLDILRRPSGNQSKRTAPEFLIKIQNVAKDQPYAMKETISAQPVLHGFPEPLPISFQGLDEHEQLNLITKSFKSTASRREASYHDENAMNYLDEKIKKAGNVERSFDDLKYGDAFGVLSQPFDNNHDYKALESVITVEEVTGSLPSDIPYATNIVPHVQYEIGDTDADNNTQESDREFSSPSEKEAENMTQESDYVAVKADRRNNDESFSDSTMAEIEAGIYGLQIIKNADLEELQELGSGTFGTVYHGKWRGTDVAIKRIKKSCFSGKSSEQERLTKDFWREARILSNLHHPNVVALYGVVPDVPGETMATVTEYMVNGSLRHALLKNRLEILDCQELNAILLYLVEFVEHFHGWHQNYWMEAVTGSQRRLMCFHLVLQCGRF